MSRVNDSPRRRLLATVAWSLVAMASLVAIATTTEAAPTEVTGRVTDVTLYRGQAMVTRTIPLEVEKGSIELIVGDLPENVVGNSLFAEGDEGIEIRAVRYRHRAVAQAPREEVRKLDEALEDLADQVAIVRKEGELLTKRAAYLDKLEGFVAPTAKLELSRGVLDAVALEKITTFSFEQRSKIGAEQLRVTREIRTLTRKIALVNRQRAMLTNGSSRTVREAVLFVEKRGAKKASLKLNYLVNGCGWSPTYAFRAAKDRQEVAIEYSAVIAQISGEDWSNVNLTLSTASPSLSAEGLGLAPFLVSLAPGNAPNGGLGNQSFGPGSDQSGGKAEQALAKQIHSYRERQQRAIVVNQNASSFQGNIVSGWDANAASCDMQNLELVGGKYVLSAMRADMQAVEGPSLSYKLATPVSLASRSDQQMIRVLMAAMKSRFYHVATPVLSSYVYREAEMVNDSAEDLLAGPVTVYLDGRFVGRGEIPTVARGETFIVGFGADPQLRARRELVERTDEIQGGNRELALDYRLVIENFKDEATTVRLLDRLPYTRESSQVRITLGKLTDKLSEDKLYLRNERPKGILRWEVKVAAGATAEDARIVNYGFKAEFDRNYRLAAVTNGSKDQRMEEYKQLQRDRRKR